MAFDEPLEKHQQKLSLAARAAWLYYIANHSQEEVAEKLHVSRQTAQRLVSFAVAEGMIKFRLDHPIASCCALAEKLQERFQLEHCEVTPSSASAQEVIHGLGVCAAEYLESFLTEKTPTILAFGTGRTMRSMVGQVSAMHQPQHKIVSVVGNMALDGRASHYGVVMQLADRIEAQAFLLQTPVLTSSVAERRYLQKLKSYSLVKTLAVQAKSTFVGISEIAEQCPMHSDGFLTNDEIDGLLKHKAVGEILGWTFNADGELLKTPINERVASIPLKDLQKTHIVAVSGGPQKTMAILAALRGKLIHSLITDEATAEKILKKA